MLTIDVGTLKQYAGVLLVWQIKRVLSILFTVALALQAIAGSAAAATIYVDDDGPGNYTTIQAALNDAVSGDTIIVNPGTYPGEIAISVPDLALVSSSQYNAVITATENAFILNANNITIKNFNIIGSGISSGYSGIADSSPACTIQNNKISNFNKGIEVSNGDGGGGGSIINNDIFDCSEGILLWSSNVDGISGNRISNCITGINVVDSYGIRFYNNNFNNTLNVQFTDKHSWNTTKTSGINIIGGPYIGGNYWATPAGDGFSQTHLDADGDGFAEAPYEMNEVNIDYLPLVTPRTDPAPALPVADFSTNATGGNAPLSVLFTDLSQNAILRSWDVNNDGIEDSNEASFVYTYTSTGTYTAKLTSINANGTNSKTAQIIVDEDSSGGSSSGGSSSGGSSSGGNSGGGGGGSPEPAKNVEVKELSQVFVTNGKAVKFDFTKNATCVVYVSFDAIKNVGKTTTIVEQLKNKSALVSELPDGEVYKSFNVWVGNSGYATSKNIENPVICFKVEKTWIQDKMIDQASIALNRYSDKKWERLSVNLSGEDANYLYFTTDVPGFSSFAITGVSKGASGEVTEKGTALETRSLQDDGNESTGLDTNVEQGESTKFSGTPSVYGIIGVLFLGLICAIIYRQLPK